MCQKIAVPRDRKEMVNEPSKNSLGCSSAPAGQRGHAERRRGGAFADNIGRCDVVPEMTSHARRLGVSFLQTRL